MDDKAEFETPQTHFLLGKCAYDMNNSDYVRNILRQQPSDVL